MKDPLKDLRNELTLEQARKRLGIFKEFKQFAMRGNVVDLAVGVVIGAAFGKIVTAMVSDLITPIVGKITPGGDDLKNKFFSLDPHKTEGIKSLADAQKAGAVIAWGDFVTNVVDFVIVAFCIFLIVKLFNRLSMASAAVGPPPEPSPTEKLLTEIRDELKSKPSLPQRHD
jgi:large conductance mechanosensitive channel